MIYDHIENRDKYSDIPGISEALNYLAGITLDNAPTEKTFLDSDDLIANPLAYETKPTSACIFEAHRKYADVHFMRIGEESISIMSTERLTETKAYCDEIDTVYYDGFVVSASVIRPGYFMVCFPHDIHRTGEIAGAPCDIQKIVVKVKINTPNGKR